MKTRKQIAFAKTIGTAMATLRKEHQLSQEYCAATKVLGSKGQISQWENGAATPTLFSLQRFCGLMGVTLEEFFRKAEL